VALLLEQELRVHEPSGGILYQWFEVWGETVSCPPYILILLGSDSDFAIIDPRKNNRVLHRTGRYEDAANWLAEDEYSPIGNRIRYDLPMPVDG